MTDPARYSRLANVLANQDGVRLYSPNPDAPTSYGMRAPEPPGMRIKPLGMGYSLPEVAWGMLPGTAKDSYRSLVNVLAELSPGAAVRDATQASGDVMRSASEGSIWGTLGNTANLLTAMAGITPGMRIAGSMHRARNILESAPFNKLTDQQAETAVNALVDALPPGAKWPGKDSLASSNRLQTQANALYPDLVAPPPSLADARAAGRAEHNTFMARSADQASRRAADIEARIAADNAVLRNVGLPENPWLLPHRQQADALEQMLSARGIPYQRTAGAEGSRYLEIPTAPGETAPSIKVRFADHANTSRLHGLPDYNITSGGGGNVETGDHTLDQIVRALGEWFR